MSKPSARATLPVDPKEIIWNPSAEDLRRLAEEMPNTRVTRYNNTNTQNSGRRAVETLDLCGNRHTRTARLADDHS
jgi:hypothetical protein